MNTSLEHLKVVGSSPTSGSIPEVLFTESFFHFCFCFCYEERDIFVLRTFLRVLAVVLLSEGQNSGR